MTYIDGFIIFCLFDVNIKNKHHKKQKLFNKIRIYILK